MPTTIFREIDFGELQMGELLGVGSYGEVHKGLWKGTEVAVKAMYPERITKQMKASFVEEVMYISLWCILYSSNFTS